MKAVARDPIAGWLVVGLIGFIVAILVVAHRTPDYEVGGLVWHVGSADVSGSVTNHTQLGCSHVSVHLTQRDKNDAIVTEDDIDAGPVDSGQTRPWSGMLLFVIPKPVSADTIKMVADGSCEDRH